MRTPPARPPQVSPLLLLVTLGLLAFVLAAGMAGCGNPPETLGTAGPTSTTAGPSGATVTETVSTAPGTGATGTSSTPRTSVANGPTTTVFTGTTGPGGGTRSLTYVGPMSIQTWQSLRTAVNNAKGDGQKVLDGVAKLSAGSAVDVPGAELDALGGIGFSAGANTTQPIAVATDPGGKQILIFSFTVTGKPNATTIVGFERVSKHVALVEGPLPISDSTKNITTIPGQ